MKYIKCSNYLNEISFINLDKIVSITKTIDGFITVESANGTTFYTNNESLKKPIEFEKILEII